MTAVNAQRAAVLAAVDAVQAAASAIDEVDAVCATGRGTAARDALRAAQPRAAKARTSLAALSGLTSRYRTALTRLGAESGTVTGAQRTAVEQVVRDGQAEAIAVQRFRTAVAGAWPVYEQLLAQEDTWVTRALVPWYRTEQEGASAYAVLVDGSRPALEQARDTVGGAAERAVDAAAVQSATLSAANTALASLRATAPPAS